MVTFTPKDSGDNPNFPVTLLSLSRGSPGTPGQQV